MPRSHVFAVLVLATSTQPGWAQPTDPDPAPEPVPSRPTFAFQRFAEDWSVLERIPPEDRTDFWDPIKYIPLDDDGKSWLSVGGHTRFRLESWSGFGFGAPADDDDTFLLWRAALHADLHVNETVRVFVEGKSAFSTDRDLPGGRRTADVDSLALEQAFVDLRLDLGSDATLTLRPGRQTFSFGKQRLVSPLPWSNTLRRWDGISAIARLGDWSVHGFFTQFAPVQKYSFNDPDRGTLFWGVYATHVHAPGRGVDLYYLGLDKDGVTFNGTTGNEERHTIGARVFGTFGTGFDYDLEAAYQFGSVGSDDLDDPLMVASQLGWKPEEWWGAPRLFIGFDYASGDDGLGGDVGTFNQLFPLGHAYFGYIDTVGRQNAVDFSAGATLEPFEKATLGATGHYFRRASNDDAMYDAGGSVVRTAPGGSRELGYEIDVTLKYAFDRHVSMLLGYSHFFAGDFIDETGKDDDIDFVYAQLQYTF